MELLDLTKPVQTRDGRQVRILCTDMIGTFPMVGLIKGHCGDEDVAMWTSDGKYRLFDDCEHDLMNVPEKHSVWINFYKSGMRYGWHTSKEMADRQAGEDRIACVNVVFNDGDGLEATK